VYIIVDSKVLTIAARRTATSTTPKTRRELFDVAGADGSDVKFDCMFRSLSRGRAVARDDRVPKSVRDRATTLSAATLRLHMIEHGEKERLCSLLLVFRYKEHVILTTGPV
jgi:hypothetical protein